MFAKIQTFIVTILCICIGAFIASIALFTAMNSIEKSYKSIHEIEDVNATKEACIRTLVQSEVDRQVELGRIYMYMLNKDLNKAELTQRAAKEFKIDALLLTALINSESSYRTQATHSLPYVKGLGGINSKYWNYPNSTVEEQIYASAIVLKLYLDKHNGDELKALTAYKGVSDLGRKQAKEVLNRYKSYKGDR